MNLSESLCHQLVAQRTKPSIFAEWLLKHLHISVSFFRRNFSFVIKKNKELFWFFISWLIFVEILSTTTSRDTCSQLIALPNWYWMKIFKWNQAGSYYILCYCCFLQTKEGFSRDGNNEWTQYFLYLLLRDMEFKISLLPRCTARNLDRTQNSSQFYLRFGIKVSSAKSVQTKELVCNSFYLQIKCFQ